MLFKSFTWQHFLIAAILLSCLWYGVVLPLLYRKQIKVWLDSRDQKKPGVAPLRRDWDEESEVTPESVEEDGLLGKPKLAEGVERVSMDGFGFTEVSGNREVQQGLVPDAMEELKSIFHILEKEDGTKADFIRLFALVRVKYAALKDTPNQRALNDFIRENALFAISDEELTNLWS